MNSVRKMQLPVGWYPQSTLDMEEFIKNDANSTEINNCSWKGAVLPHAGWYYSGSFAWDFCRSVDYTPDCVLLLGGHMHSFDPFRLWNYSSLETPFGNLEVHQPLVQELQKTLLFEEDRIPDNTVEVFLPLLKWFWPESQVLVLRMPPSIEALSYAEKMERLLQDFTENPLIIASTDLTHYGGNYQFFPDLNGDSAEKWVEKNDYCFIESVLERNSRDLLKTVEALNNACSPGSVSFLMEMMNHRQNIKAQLIRYGSSLDKGSASSFVGYCSIGFY